MNFNTLVKDIYNQLKNCVPTESFVKDYIINAVLSYIEEVEQELILAMRYNEFVRINFDAVIDKIKNYLSKLYRACGLEEPLFENINRDIVYYALCYLYVKGIYNDCFSKYLLIKDNGDLDKEIGSCNDDAVARCVKYLSTKGGVEVRSRFIEIARDLYYLKQRFPDRSVFASPYVVDRVFAYVHPREVPLGRLTASDVCSPDSENHKLIEKAEQFFRGYYKHFSNNEPDEATTKSFREILCEFFKRLEEQERIRWRQFQVNGIERALEKLRRVLEGQDEYLVIEAPTGSGKTEIIVVTNIIAALARRLIFNKLQIRSGTPAAIIIYPRRSLANDQVSRLIRYVEILNTILMDKSLGQVTISLNYTETRPKEDYLDGIKKLDKLRNRGCEKINLKYGVVAYLCKEQGREFIELRFISCQVDGKTSYVRVPIRRVADDVKLEDTVICGDRKIKFLYLFKDQIRKDLGDIHITTFETLRLNALYSRSKVFGELLESRAIHPLILTLDEIHTYVDVPGVRYAHMIRRFKNRAKRLCQDQSCKNYGVLVIGMSATIPHAEEFLSSLFTEKIKERIKEYVVEVLPDEKIPLGNEYFYIVVPSYKAGVNSMVTSIQSIMAIFYNLPSIPSGNQRVKRGIVFVDDFNVLRRFVRDLYLNKDAALIREEGDDKYGLQDLRNPFHSKFERTCEEYKESKECHVAASFTGSELSKFVNSKARRDGELWWGYALDYLAYSKSRLELPVCVIEYSSRRQDVECRRGGSVGLVVATSALEVGVDYSDIVMIYQHGAPPNIAALVQRAGRAGRRVFEYPLMRVAIGIQLSPEFPHQSWLFEIFTRSKSLRDALEYDRLYLPVRSSEIAKQTIVDTAIEYIPGKKSSKNLEEIECKIPSILAKEDFKNYVSDILSEWFKKDDIKSMVEKILNEFRRACENGSS